MPTNIKWKMQACFVLYFKFWEGTSVKSYKIQLPVLLSIALQLFRTSLNIIWKRFLSLLCCASLSEGARWIKCIRGKIINDLEGFFSQSLQFDSPYDKAQKGKCDHSVYLPFFWEWGGVGGWAFYQVLKKRGGLTGCQFLEGGCS